MARQNTATPVTDWLPGPSSFMLWVDFGSSGIMLYSISARTEGEAGVNSLAAPRSIQKLGATRAWTSTGGRKTPALWLIPRPACSERLHRGGEAIKHPLGVELGRLARVGGDQTVLGAAGQDADLVPLVVDQ